MTIRTITGLPDLDPSDNKSDSYMEMSVPMPATNHFASKRVKYGEMRNDVCEYTSEKMADNYGLKLSSEPVNVAQMQTSVENILSNDCSLSGKKGFESWPYVKSAFPTAEELSTPSFSDFYGDDGKYILPNIDKVKEMIDDNIIFMSTEDSLVAEGNPLPAHSSSSTITYVPESLEYSSTIGSGKFYFWHIDSQQTDSSTAVQDPNSGSVDGYEQIRDTGNLVMWGWLADNPEPNAPQPEQCWVGLFAKMKCEGGDSTEMDVPVAIQPWIRGKHASDTQYVSFNIPVKKGLRLKVKTGFPVNAENSGLQNPGSLTFLDRNVPNAFFGYVIK